MSYLKKSIIDTKISVLSEQERRHEIDLPTANLTDEDGKAKRATDLNNNASVAWQTACRQSLRRNHSSALKNNLVLTSLVFSWRITGFCPLV